MYTLVESWRPVAGKDAQAVSFLKEMCEYVNRQYPPASPWSVHAEVFGDHGTLFLLGAYNTLADVEQLFAWAGTDQGLKELLRKRDEEGLFVSGSGHVRVLRSR